MKSEMLDFNTEVLENAKSAENLGEKYQAAFEMGKEALEKYKWAFLPSVLGKVLGGSHWARRASPP